MPADTTSGRAVGFLLDLIDSWDADRVRARAGLPRPAPEDLREARRRLPWELSALPSSVVLWMLQEDDPDLNAVVWRLLPDQDTALRRAILDGVPFSPGRLLAVEVDPVLRDTYREPPVPDRVARLGLVPALRESTTMAAAREATSMVYRREHWQTVAEADRENSLPGYVRWALAIRADCPPSLRAQFGAHRKFDFRVRQAGIMTDPAEYAVGHGPALDVLKVLSLGHMMFPRRIAEAENALRPLVRDHLGTREEAWAALTQLLQTFHGTTEELVVTAGAIA
ncbi:hypothetical protein ABTY98_13645 [Streptomyces sp. NPDC096040]|uniref:hypothetical protein n=1 Tax=Streptomyces sp. NPDC096040 TaxID=3155541 RepID=UPI00331A1E54